MSTSRKKTVLIVVGTGAVVCLITIAVIVAIRLNDVFGFVSPSLGSRKADYEQIINDILSSKPKASGVHRLPVAQRSATPRGDVYVEVTADGRTLILFPTWYGRGEDVEGYLYASGGLKKSDYYQSGWGSEVVDVGPVDWLDVSPVETNWYWATRRVD